MSVFENWTIMPTASHAHLKQLEAESIRIMRQVATDFENPVFL